MTGKFKAGDVVQLASGGPKMTVVGDGTMTGHIYCRWFDDSNALTGEQFHPDTLVTVPRSESAGQQPK
jgi:uncharacterized protein YodC (DUF2158 family)